MDLYLSNMIEIEKNNKILINSFLEKIFYKIKKDFLNHNFTSDYEMDVLLLISEAYFYLDDKKVWKQIGLKIIENIKKRIRNQYYSNNIGMIGGLGNAVFCINFFGEVIGDKRDKTLTNLLINEASSFANFFLATNKDTYMNDYDCISGISGVLHYLLGLDFENDKLESLILYLLGLFSSSTKNSAHTKFYISKENQFTEEDQIKYPDGNYNLGFAHGTLGTLVSLAKSINYGYNNKYSIRKCVDLAVEKYQKGKILVNDDMPVWPTILDAKDYLKSKLIYDVNSYKATWCYGNLGVALGLYKIFSYLQDEENKKLYEKYLLTIINRKTNEYFLDSPILCHGFSSVITIQIEIYKCTKNIEYTKSLNQNIKEIFNCIGINSDQDYSFEEINLDLSLLNGLTGIALTLINALTFKTRYQQMLMVNLDDLRFLDNKV